VLKVPSIGMIPDECRSRPGTLMIPAGDANRCWTGAIRTSEKAVKAKFAKLFVRALRCIGA
jgi:hypothetical protein